MNKFLADFDKELDKLDVQVDLGADELSDAFEQSKSQFTAFLDEAAKTVDSLEHSESVQNFRTKIDELRVQLALGKAEGKDAFEAQKTELDNKMQEAQKAYGEWKEDANEDSKELKEAFEHRMTHFRTNMDVMRVQFHLGMAEAKDEWEEAKKEVKEKVSEVKRFWEERNKEGESRWEEFSEEVDEAYSHIKSAMGKLFTKHSKS